MVYAPTGPPPPSVPEGWKAHWNTEYKTWFYENIYTEETSWEKPTEPVYPPQARSPLPPTPPPAYTPASRQGDIASLQNSMGSVSLSEGKPSLSQEQAQQPVYDYGFQSQQTAPYAPQRTPQQTSQRIPQQPVNATGPPQTSALQTYPIQPNPHTYNSATTTRGYPGQPQAQQGAAQQPPHAGYHTQQDPPGLQRRYPQQKPASPQQQSIHGQQRQLPYAQQQPAYGQQQQQQQPPHPRQQPAYPQQQPSHPQKQLPQGPGLPQPAVKKSGGAIGTILGVGAGLLAGGFLEHEWEEHKNHERPNHQGGVGGGLMASRGLDGTSYGDNTRSYTDSTRGYMDDSAPYADGTTYEDDSAPYYGGDSASYEDDSAPYEDDFAPCEDDYAPYQGRDYSVGQDIGDSTSDMDDYADAQAMVDQSVSDGFDAQAAAIF